MEHTCPLFGFPQREHLYAFLTGSDGFALTPEKYDAEDTFPMQEVVVGGVVEESDAL